MDQIMAPDFTFVALDKSVFGRKAFEEAVREARKTFDTSSVKLKLEKVRIEGSKGIATLTATTDAAFKDSKKKTHTLLTVEVVEMTHVKDGGIWKVTSGKSLNFSQKIDGKRTH
jgi:ketosteroid isomerase-like protein